VLVGARAGAVWVDILGRRLHRDDVARAVHREWTFDETISAVAERRTLPGLAVTLRRGLALFDPEVGTITRLHEPERERANNRFNDGKCDAQGRFWGGSMDFERHAPTGALYRFDADGAARARPTSAGRSSTGRPGRSTAARSSSTTPCTGASSRSRSIPRRARSARPTSGRPSPAPTAIPTA
jgi:sugar lactone lactonase YvrE